MGSNMRAIAINKDRMPYNSIGWHFLIFLTDISRIQILTLSKLLDYQKK